MKRPCRTHLYCELFTRTTCNTHPSLGLIFATILDVLSGPHIHARDASELPIVVQLAKKPIGLWNINVLAPSSLIALRGMLASLLLTRLTPLSMPIGAPTYVIHARRLTRGALL